MTVDSGPTSLAVGVNAYIPANFAYVSVTLCAPRSTVNCQVIDHVQVDTGSVGLRIFAPVLNASLLAALPQETDPQGNAVGECFEFVDSYMFGSVRQADVSVGGESVSGMPIQAVADSGQFATIPSQCSSGGGSNLNSVFSTGANGLIGLGVTTTDCGSLCATNGGYGAAIYYDCPASGCVSIIPRAPKTSAPFQQLPNFASALPVDNNGVILSLPSATNGGQDTLMGTLYFGIGTRSNNGLGSATVLATSTSNSILGAGFITAIYKQVSFQNSYIDSGTDLELFTDSAIPVCSGTYAGYYCPTSDITVTPTLEGGNGTSQSVELLISNSKTLLSTSYAVLPGLAGDPKSLSNTMKGYSNTFAFGLPFFFGRNVYFGIEGAQTGQNVGPFFAF